MVQDSYIFKMINKIILTFQNYLTVAGLNGPLYISLLKKYIMLLLFFYDPMNAAIA